LTPPPPSFFFFDEAVLKVGESSIESSEALEFDSLARRFLRGELKRRKERVDGDISFEKLGGEVRR